MTCKLCTASANGSSRNALVSGEDKRSTLKLDTLMEDEVPNADKPTGFLLFHMLAAIDEFECDLIKECASASAHSLMS